MMLKWWHKDRWTTIHNRSQGPDRYRQQIPPGHKPLALCIYKLHFTYIHSQKSTLKIQSSQKSIMLFLADFFSSLLLKGSTHCHILLWSTVLTDIYYSTEWMNQSVRCLLRFSKQGLCYGKLWGKFLHTNGCNGFSRTGSVNFFYKGPELVIVLWVCKRISLPSGNTHRYWGIFIFATFLSVNLF